MATALLKRTTRRLHKRLSNAGQQRLLITAIISLYLALNYAGNTGGNPWIHGISFLGGLSLVIAFYKWQQTRLIQQLRNKISADLHDEVGGLLTGLAMQTELLEFQTKDPKNHQQLRRIAELSRKAMANMRDMVWAMDSEKDTWGSLIDRLYCHASEVLHPRNIELSIQTQSIQADEKIPTEQREHLYLIAKEALTNVAKHANASQVQISLQKTEYQFQMMIQDNGTAIQLNRGGVGLESMKRRAREMGGQLKIAVQNGCQVALHCPC
ncbi:MAG: hypothetical protein KDC44_10795 [Phaeodactylibacter sp.]|nr:hypothetical protein [Phaeodactylibacter sp.]